MRARLAVGLACALVAGEGRANPLDMYGFGSRSAALGGAVSADVRDVSAVYYNPAGLARLRGMRVEVGYLYAQPRLAINGQDTGVSATHGLVAGIAAPGRVFGLPFAFGIGVHLPDDRLTQVRALPQTQPRWELYDVRLQRLYIAAMVAISPWPWLRLGGGVAFMASTRGSVDITGSISATSRGETALTHTVDVDLSTVRYAQFGAQVDLGRGVTVAFAWRDRFNLDLTIALALRGNIVVGHIDNPNAVMVPGTYSLASRTLTAFQPRQWVLGGAWVIDPRWRVMADVTWSQWSQYPNPTAELATSLDIRIPPSLSSLVRAPSIPPTAPREDARFHDTLVVRVGAERTIPVGRHAVHLRAGYTFDPSPIPPQPGVTNFVDVDRHVVTAGLGLSLHDLSATLPGTLSFDVHGMAQILADRDTMKTSPVDPVGDFTAGGTVFAAGATASMEFE